MIDHWQPSAIGHRPSANPTPTCLTHDLCALLPDPHRQSKLPPFPAAFRLSTSSSSADYEYICWRCFASTRLTDAFLPKGRRGTFTTIAGLADPIAHHRRPNIRWRRLREPDRALDSRHRRAPLPFRTRSLCACSDTERTYQPSPSIRPTAVGQIRTLEVVHVMVLRGRLSQ